MGGHVSKMLDLRSRWADEEYAREQLLGGKYLELNYYNIPWVLNHIDCFVSQSRGNESVQQVYVCLDVSSNGHDDDIWEKVAQAIGNLQAFERLHISGRSREITFNHESLTEILRLPSLRFVCFSKFNFTSALCQATANALLEGTAITNLRFEECSFPAGESAAIMATGLGRNTSVTSISVDKWCDNAGALHSALAAALPSNSTLWHLALSQQDDCFPAVFLALGKNRGLETLRVHGFGSMDESLCTAIKDGLGMNETLESLELNSAHLTDDNIALWCRAFAFLRVNKALKSLLFDASSGVEKSCLSAVCIDMAASLQENTSLESLTFRKYGKKIKAEEMIAIVTALQHNTTLRTLSLNADVRLQLTDDEDKQMASLLKRNYALENIPGIDLDNEEGDTSAILQLNAAGRRYLIEDGSSISKGVEVLSRVNNEISCVFFHLLENPRLCDRRAVEMAVESEC
jgi:hypothetical protein